jgi:tellurite resistance protein TehA-like permease
VLWALAVAWLPALLAGELLAPRAGAVPDRWSTAFPVGMYAAMSFAVSHVAGLAWLEDIARGWTVVAAAVWALVLVGSFARPVTRDRSG